MSLQVDIKKKYGTFTLDVAIEAGDEILGFLGASGCGKSLTLRCIAGVETPDEGRIVVNDQVFFDSEEGVNLTPQQRKTALLFQNYQLFPNLTVEQNVAAGISKNVSAQERTEMIQGELARFSLKGLEKRYPAQLSGGQQQRVALARMLAARPAILMLDEPFSALDAHLKGVLEQSLSSTFESFKGTILYVSHDIDEALRFCDRIAVVEAGHILEIDTGDELVNNPQTVAALKLSGCKNITGVELRDAHHLFAPEWGITLESDVSVAQNVAFVGVRAFSIERASGPGKNCFQMEVDRTTDSRFERTVLLSFVNREGGSLSASIDDGEMSYLHQRLMWRVSRRTGEELPVKGDRLWIRIPEDKWYLVEK
jgi:molybdate transport system ATP-binding protein